MLLGPAAHPSTPGVLSADHTLGRARPRSRRPDTVAILIALLLVVAIAFRVYALGRLPGINGDEAWYGVQAERILAGVGSHWRTPTGNLPGPIHLALLVILLKLFGPSLALLRMPSVICSLAAMVLAWEVGRRHFDRATATAALLLMAALPVTIASARFGWDPSDDMMVGLLAAGCALAGRPLPSALAFALALAVHPTNVFLAPFLAIAFLGADLDRGDGRRAAWRSAGHVAALCMALALLKIITSPGQLGFDLAATLRRIGDPEEWREFALLFVRFLSGDSVYAYIAGTSTGWERSLGDAIITALLIGLGASGVATLRRRGCARLRGVVVGWIASVAAFFVLAGHDAIVPPVMRYAYPLVVPTVLALAVLIAELAEGGTHPERPSRVAAGLAALMLAGFALCYLVPLATTGKAGHDTFATGPVEPKRAALTQILAAGFGRPVTIVAPSWWAYWTLAYLAHGGPATVLGRVPPRDVGRYWVVYTGDPDDRRLARLPGATLRGLVRGGGRPDLLHIWWLPAA